MRYISLASLVLGLDDLLTKRENALKSFASGAASAAMLTARRDKMKALPPAAQGRPLADELDQTDMRHDGIGAAVWAITEAYLRHPDTTQQMLDAAKRIREKLIGSLDDLTASYVTEANAAKTNKAELPSLKNDLDLFPVAGGTLHDWALGFVTAGEQLDTLLSQRADAKDRAAAALLRMEAIGILNRLRKNLAAEAKGNANLPADLDDQVFGYFDLLETQDAAAAAEEKKKKAAAKAAKAGAPAAGAGGPSEGSGGTPA